MDDRMVATSQWKQGYEDYLAGESPPARHKSESFYAWQCRSQGWHDAKRDEYLESAVGDRRREEDEQTESGKKSAAQSRKGKAAKKA